MRHLSRRAKSLGAGGVGFSLVSTALQLLNITLPQPILLLMLGLGVALLVLAAAQAISDFREPTEADLAQAKNAIAEAEGALNEHGAVRTGNDALRALPSMRAAMVGLRNGYRLPTPPERPDYGNTFYDWLTYLREIVPLLEGGHVTEAKEKAAELAKPNPDVGAARAEPVPEPTPEPAAVPTEDEKRIRDLAEAYEARQRAELLDKHVVELGKLLRAPPGAIPENVPEPMPGYERRRILNREKMLFNMANAQFDAVKNELAQKGFPMDGWDAAAQAAIDRVTGDAQYVTIVPYDAEFLWKDPMEKRTWWLDRSVLEAKLSYLSTMHADYARKAKTI